MTCQTVAVLNMTWTSGDVIVPTLGTGGHIPGVLTSTFHLELGQLRISPEGPFKSLPLYPADWEVPASCNCTWQEVDQDILLLLLLILLLDSHSWLLLLSLVHARSFLHHLDLLSLPGCYHGSNSHS